MTAPKPYPVIFSAPMVRALLDGSKTQTRRVAWGEPFAVPLVGFHPVKKEWWAGNVHNGVQDFCKPSPWLRRYERWLEGERPWLYVREKHWCVEIEGGGIGCPYLVFDEEWTDGPGAKMPKPTIERPWLGPPYFDDEDQEIRWGARPSIHMPRWASRFSLRITDMRRERLRDISEEDAGKEGAADLDKIMRQPAKFWFRQLWEDIHGLNSWEANPEIIAVSFEVHQENIERIAA